MKKFLRGARAYKPDVEDVVGALGLVLLGYGLWRLSPELALIVMGCLLLLGAIVRVRAMEARGQRGQQ